MNSEASCQWNQHRRFKEVSIRVTLQHPSNTSGQPPPLTRDQRRQQKLTKASLPTVPKNDNIYIIITVGNLCSRQKIRSASSSKNSLLKTKSCAEEEQQAEPAQSTGRQKRAPARPLLPPTPRHVTSAKAGQKRPRGKEGNKKYIQSRV